jgi:DNA-directed RNA polymerase subunit alpha
LRRSRSSAASARPSVTSRPPLLTPVKKVNYTVETPGIGQNTDMDMVPINVWTDGSVKPNDAIGLAAKLTKDHMQIFINFEDVLNRSMDEPGLSVRSYNCLKNANIRSIL